MVFGDNMVFGEIMVFGENIVYSENLGYGKICFFLNKKKMVVGGNIVFGKKHDFG